MLASSSYASPLISLFFPYHSQISLWILSFTLLQKLLVIPQSMEISIFPHHTIYSYYWINSMLCLSWSCHNKNITDWVTLITKLLLILLEVGSQVLDKDSLHSFQMTVISIWDQQKGGSMLLTQSLSKHPFPDTITLGMRVSIYDFWGDTTIQSTVCFIPRYVLVNKFSINLEKVILFVYCIFEWDLSYQPLPLLKVIFCDHILFLMAWHV